LLSVNFGSFVVVMLRKRYFLSFLPWAMCGRNENIDSVTDAYTFVW